METATSIEDVRASVGAARNSGKTIGLVPTMGALHAGHISLIEAAVKRCDFVVVSIFVNPTQFGPGEDLEQYPRPVEADLEICRNSGVDVVFMPSAEQMYPAGNQTWVTVEKLTDVLCGVSRPKHFRGVTTVCAKLFNIVGADIAFFGQKDAQQAIIIKRMVSDLNMRLEIVVCPTVREKSGLAVSSRNQYLSPQEKKDASLIYKSLAKSRQMLAMGEFQCELIAGEMRRILGESAAIEIEYISIVDAESLERLEYINKKALIAVAVRLGTTRLIDNIIVEAKPPRMNRGANY